MTSAVKTSVIHAEKESEFALIRLRMLPSKSSQLLRKETFHRYASDECYNECVGRAGPNRKSKKRNR